MNLQYKTAPSKSLYPLKSEIEKHIQSHDFMCVPFNKGQHIIRYRDILFLKSESSYTLIYMVDGKKILSSKTLKSFSEILPDQLFMRVHRSYIIPMKRVEAIINKPSGILINSEHIPVSKNYRSQVRDYFL